MRIAITILFTFFLTVVYGQANDYKVFLDSAKTLFKGGEKLNQEEYDRLDYYQIVSLLEKAIELNPQSAEARYFLGYTYSRINSRDGRGMIAMDLNLLYKSSEQFENTIKLSPKYANEIIILDPYSKLTAEWGSMAMSYWHNNKADSARWAFKEGKNRGGFGDFILKLNKKVLDACSKNAILVSSGDNFTIPLWYLQIVENYRTDVTVIDISLLNTNWYPAFLSKTKSVLFDLPNEVLDTIEYVKWADSTITINNFSWTVKPSYYNQYLLRGDRVFLSLLKENKFERELFFTIAFAENSRLSLKNYLTSFVVIDKLTLSEKLKQGHEDYKKKISSVLQLSENINRNSPDEVRFYDYFRYHLLGQVNDYLNNNEKKKAKELMAILDKYGNDEKYPYENAQGKEYADYLRGRL